MGKDEGNESERNGEERKESEQAHSEDGFRDDQISIKEKEEALHFSSLRGVIDQKEAQTQTNECGKAGHDERVAECFPKKWRAEEFFIPFQGKALPRRGKAFAVKGEEQKDGDRQVKEEIKERNSNIGGGFFKQGLPLASRGSSILCREEERQEAAQERLPR